MKKPANSKKPVKKVAKKTEADELRKPAKLKPMKEKEKKNWKQSLDDEELDIDPEEDVKLDDLDLNEEDEEFFDDSF